MTRLAEIPLAPETILFDELDGIASTSITGTCFKATEEVFRENMSRMLWARITGYQKGLIGSAGQSWSAAMPQRSSATSWSFFAKRPDPQEQIYNALEKLYVSPTKRDRQIAERLDALRSIADEEEVPLNIASLNQLVDFFLANPNLPFPKIFLTNGTFRVRWIKAKDAFTAFEFTGDPLAKIAAEAPRTDGLTARLFSFEPVTNLLAAARAFGASFA
jgi:hypothetical protein